VKLVALSAVPPGVVIPILPVFAPEGTVAITCVSESTVKLVAATPPKVTFVVCVKLTPVIVTTGRLSEFGFAGQARRAVSQALALAPEPNVRTLGALALSRSGELIQASRLADALDQELPLHLTMQNYWLPLIRASVELGHGSPARAVDRLQVTLPYELGSTDIFQLATMYPVYVRGLAYLQAKQSREAAAEFQKMLDRPSIIINFPLRALAHLQLARARMLSHDNEGARKAYADFLTLWKDADPDIPILKEAKAEYAKLP